VNRHALAKRAAATLLVMVALSSGCAAKPSPDAPALAAATTTITTGEEPPSPLGRDWMFVEVDGFDGTLPSPPPVAGFIMTREAQRLTGTTGCNRMGSGYELDVHAGTLRFTKLNNTRMMCDRVAADTEEAVLNAMIVTDSYRIVDGKLELLSKGKVVARLTAP